MSSNIAEILTWGTNRLAGAGVDNPRHEAEYILAGVKRTGRTQVLAGLELSVDSAVEELFRGNIEKRSRRIPFNYIFKTANFMGYNLTVTADTLIPRPETEILVEEAVKYLKDKTGSLKVLDIGTGSGNIAIAMAKLTGAQITAVDISSPALKVAAENVKKHNVDSCIELIKSDIYKNLNDDFFNSFDLIISNPPYVNSEEYVKIEPEVKKEPKNALAATGYGLDIIKEILTGAGKFIKNNGVVFVEIGYNQRKELEKFISGKIKFSKIRFVKDYGKIDRILKLII